MNFISQRLEKVEWKIAIKTGLSAGLGLFLGLALSQFLQRPDTIISGMWSALAAIVVQQAHLGSTYKSAWLRFLGVMIGCFMGGFFTWLLGSNPISLCLSIIITIVVCSIFGLKESVRISCLSVAVVMILWGLRPTTSPWLFSFFRFLDSCLGVAAAVVIAHLFWPAQVSKKMGLSVSKTFRNLIELYDMAVALEPLTEKKREAFRLLSSEIVDLLWKNRTFLEDSKLELLTKFSGLDEWKMLYGHMDLLYENIISLSRVRKTALEKIIDQELQKGLDKMLEQTRITLTQYAEALEGKRADVSWEGLKEAIALLENQQNRFRSRHVTRKHEFEDVEGLYVFFYSLRVFALELIKTGKHMNALLES